MRLSARLVLLWWLTLPVARANLIGHWNFDQPSPTWTDSAGPVFTHGTNSGGVTGGAATVPAGTYGALTVSPGQSAAWGSAISVPANASVFLGSAVGSDLNRTGDFTVMAWVNPTQTTGSHMFFATGAGGENGWKFGHQGLQLRFTANAVADVDVPAGSFTLTTGIWQHWALTVAGTAGARTLNFYVNGNPVHATTVANILPSTSPNMMIGNNGEQDPGTAGGVSFQENFNGRIDELRFFDRALTPAEVIQVVPEPSALPLLGLGLLALVVRARRRRA